MPINPSSNRKKDQSRPDDSSPDIGDSGKPPINPSSNRKKDQSRPDDSSPDIGDSGKPPINPSSNRKKTEPQPEDSSPNRGEGRVRGVEFARRLRQHPTPQERKMWYYLRDKRLSGLKFRRQHPIGPYVADFYCAEARLVVELDGSWHAYQVEYDQARTGWLQANGYRVIRFNNAEVDCEIEAVLEKILAICVQEIE